MTRLSIILTTALAPLIWGSTYLVTTEFLPPQRPFTAALLRVLPAGILLLAYTRERPERHDWGKILLLGVLNIGLIQAMLFIAAYRLPGGLAAVLSSTQTLMVLLFTWMIMKMTSASNRASTTTLPLFIHEMRPSCQRFGR